MDRFLAQENKGWIDSISLVLAIVVTYLSLSHIDGMAYVTSLIESGESVPLGNLVLTLACSSVYLLIYIFRRHYELSNKTAQANQDALVGIYNRRKGTELLEDELQRANLHRVPLSVIMFDIDNFKAINDTFGHDKGDEVLKEVINQARQHSRKTDILIRWGGEEFVIGCCNTKLEAANKMADRIRQAICDHQFSLGERVTASFGITEYQLCEDLDEFIGRADKLLYKSKKAGKNRLWSCDLLDEEDWQLQ